MFSGAFASTPTLSGSRAPGAVVSATAPATSGSAYALSANLLQSAPRSWLGLVWIIRLDAERFPPVRYAPNKTVFPLGDILDDEADRFVARPRSLIQGGADTCLLN